MFKRDNPALRDLDNDPPHLLLRRADLLKALTEEAEKLGVHFLFGATVSEIDFERTTIQLLNGEIHNFDVIFGADGPKSFSRGLLFGTSYGPQPSGDLAYRMLIPVSEISKDEGLLRLVEDTAIGCWMGPDSHLVCYPLGKESLLNVVLAGQPSCSASVDNLEAYEEEVENLLTYWDPQVQKLCRLAETIIRRRLEGSHELASWSHPSGTFALVGDSCHTSLPLL